MLRDRIIGDFKLDPSTRADHDPRTPNADDPQLQLDLSNSRNLARLVEMGAIAEDAGFDSVMISERVSCSATPATRA